MSWLFGSDDKDSKDEPKKDKKKKNKDKDSDDSGKKEDNGGLLQILTTDGITETMTPTSRQAGGKPKAPPSVIPEKLRPGATLKRAAVDDEEAVHKWQSVDGATFSVRQGPDYKQHRKKDLSIEALYDCFAVDCFFSEQKIVDLSSRFILPTVNDCGPADLFVAEKPSRASGKRADSEEKEKLKATEKGDRRKIPEHIETKQADNTSSAMKLDAETLKIMKELEIPPLWIINSLWPAYPPNNPIWGSSKDDGETYALVMWCRLSAAGVKAIKERSPAALLLSKFVKGIQDKNVNDRFKCVPRLAPHSQVQLPWYLKQYNEMPFLTRPQHKFIKHKDAIEAVVDVHQFTYIVRKGFSMFFTSVKEMVADYAFVIEAREDDEMNEQILLCMRLARFDYSAADIVD